MERYFSDVEAKFIRDYQANAGYGIDKLSDDDIKSIQSQIGDHGKTVRQFRDLLGNERRKGREKVGVGPYLNFRKKIESSELQTCEHSDEYVNLSDLNVDSAYQRSDYVNKKVVRSIQQGFNQLLAGVITVAKRSDGSLWVVDGHHRVLGARAVGIATLRCVIFDSRGSEHEAEVFYELNTKRTGINCISMYKAMLTQKEEATVHIQQLLEKYGFAIGKKTGQFSAANTIRDSYQRGVLDRVLYVIKESFQGGSERWKWMFGSSHFVQMLTVIYCRCGECIDDDRMSLVLARMQHVDYQRMAARFAGTTGNRAGKIAPEFIEAIYNRGIRKNRVVWER